MSADTVTHREDAIAVVYVRMPGWLKNQIVDWCGKSELSVNSWAANVLKRALEEEWGLPEPPPAAAPLPTPYSVVSSYLSGETVLEPCGEPSPCGRTEVVDVAGVGYCDKCNIRLT